MSGLVRISWIYADGIDHGSRGSTRISRETKKELRSLAENPFTENSCWDQRLTRESSPALSRMSHFGDGGPSLLQDPTLQDSRTATRNRQHNKED